MAALPADHTIPKQPKPLPKLVSPVEVLRTLKPKQFGGWTLDRADLCLIWHDAQGNERYPVDCARLRTSAAVLDLICQVAGKTWATDAVLAGLVRALDHFLDPQARLCSLGTERGPINVRKLLQVRARP